MVQAGSNLKPHQSVSQAKAEVNRAKQALLEAERLHDEAQRRLEETVAHANEISKDQLVERLSEEQKLQKETKEKEVQLTETEKQLKVIQVNLLSGGMAGVIARSCVAPMDRIKILQQTSSALGGEYENASIMQVFRRLMEKEGLGKLWRGNLTNCIRVFPHAATQFTAYDFFKAQLQVLNMSPNSYAGKVLCGGLAGATAVTVTHPMDLVRIRLQTQPELKGIGDSMKRIMQTRGVMGFYKGYTSAVLSLSPFIAVNFTTFDIIKSLYFGDQKLTKIEIKKKNPLLNLVFGAASGLVAQTVCYPLDTVRRQMAVDSSKYSGNVDAARQIFKSGGFRGFYKGMGANALKVAPNNAIRFFAFEFIRDTFF